MLFVCREHKGHLCDLVQHRGFRVGRLPLCSTFAARSTAGGSPDSRASLLGASWEADWQQTCALIGTYSVSRPSWLVVDHYAIDHRWESASRESAERIMAVDDLADRVHDCDVLLDQNLVADMGERYASKGPDHCRILSGPRFALLQSEYAGMRQCLSPRRGAVRSVLISFGGTDSENLTGRCLSAFLSLRRSQIRADVVITSFFPHADSVLRLAEGHENVRVHRDLPTLACLIAAADLGVGAGGGTSWERLCLGLPSLVITSAENQSATAEEQHRLGLIRWLGHASAVDEGIVAHELERLFNVGLEEAWRLRCLRAVDGRGAFRTTAAMLVGPSTALRVRHAQLDDEALLLEWANDPRTRRNGFSADPIPAEDHRRWLSNRLLNVDGCRLYIVETTAGVPVGPVRFERLGGDWEVHYALAPEFRGRGLGKTHLNAALVQLRAELGSVMVCGRVKQDNRASQRVFVALGFQARRGPVDGVLIYSREA